MTEKREYLDKGSCFFCIKIDLLKLPGCAKVTVKMRIKVGIWIMC